MTHLCVDPPDRLDLSFRSNDDAVVGLAWIASLRSPSTTVLPPPPGPTAVAMTAGVVSFAFDPPRQTYDDNGVPLPRDSEVHVIASTAEQGAAGGWIDPEALAAGLLQAFIPHGVWGLYATSSGVWDAVVVPRDFDGSPQKCLARGVFVVEEGVGPSIVVLPA